jgi:WhiB family redox-sensing transcriptional regulator
MADHLRRGAQSWTSQENRLHARIAPVSFAPENPQFPSRYQDEEPCEKAHKVRKTLLTTITTDWRDLAACRDSEPSLFFPVGTTGPAIDQIEAAIAICSTCQAQEDCLQYALETNQESGVWGGYAEDDRRRLRKRWLAERRRRSL